MFYTFLMPLPYLIPMLGGLAACIKYRKLSAYMPLLITGFAFGAGTHILPSMMQWLFFLHVNYTIRPDTALFDTFSSYNALALVNAGAWILIACGIGAVLHEMSQKLALQDMDQNLLDLNKIHLNNASDAYHRQSALEENHATAFTASSIAPAAPGLYASSPNVSIVQPVRNGAVEQPDITIPLGSSHS